MQVNKFHILMLLLLLCGSCIDPFDPEIRESQEVLAISGFVTDRSGRHQVLISRSTPYNDPSFVPVSGCVVYVEDNEGTLVSYTEISPGIYEAYLDYPFLEVGKSYALVVIAPDGNQYRSDHDPMLPCATVDSIYYEVKTKPTADPNDPLQGVQFYVDMEGDTESATSYRWLLEETWWYTAPVYATHIWDGVSLREYTADYYCNITDTVRGFYSGSTRNLSANALTRHPLHYVSNATPRLILKYSVLVMQHSLSDEAYDFWMKMGSQSSEGVSLYETQPTSTVGNIYNVNDPSERVLGVFYATQVKEKRLTIFNHFDFEVDGYSCALDTIMGPEELGDDLPYFLASIDPTGFGGPPYLVGSRRCFDCRYFGGTTNEPGF